MNEIDIVISVIFIYAAVKGFIRGIVKEIAGVFAIIAGLYVSANFSAYTIGLLNEYFGLTGGYVKPVAFLVTFILVLIIIKLLAAIIDNFLDFAGLSFFVKLGGMIFSVVKWMLIVGAILIALLNFNRSVKNSFLDQSIFDNSILANVSMSFSNLFLPDNIFLLNEQNGGEYEK